MRIQDSLHRFRDLCAAAGLDPDHLAPWPAWKSLGELLLTGAVAL